MTSEAREQEIALMEAHMIGFADGYFYARNPMLDTTDRRRVFEAGFKAAWSDRTAAIEAARVEEREKALEEAAKACEKFGVSYDNEWNRGLGVADGLRGACEECAESIRSLAKEAPHG